MANFTFREATITDGHVKQAIKEIKEKGVIKGKESDKFLVEFEGIYFPVKHVVSVAYEYATRKELNSNNFIPEEAIECLGGLGFTCVEYKRIQK